MNSLTCQSCLYHSYDLKAYQKCDQNRTRECKKDTKYCITANVTDIKGNVTYFRDCNEKPVLCPDSKRLCDALFDKTKLRSCVVGCCQTDKCNNFYPRPTSSTRPTSSARTTSSATDIMVSTFALILIVIAGLLAS